MPPGVLNVELLILGSFDRKPLLAALGDGVVVLEEEHALQVDVHQLLLQHVAPFDVNGSGAAGPRMRWSADPATCSCIPRLGYRSQCRRALLRKGHFSAVAQSVLAMLRDRGARAQSASRYLNMKRNMRVTPFPIE